MVVKRHTGGSFPLAVGLSQRRGGKRDQMWPTLKKPKESGQKGLGGSHVLVHCKDQIQW